MVRIAVIGIGGWGKNHVRVLNELDALAAVCDANRERMQLYSRKYRVPGYENVDSMLKKEKLDGVTICTPASTHFAIASKVLGEGLTTFVEKPMTTTSKDGEILLEVAKKARKVLTVGFIERFNPPISDLKRMITEGRLGAPILLEFHRENRRGDVLDVGIVKDASVHDIVVSQQTQVHEEDGTRMPKLVIQEPLMLELKEYLAAIEEKRQPLVRGEDGLMVTRIAEAVLASSHSGTPIFMKP